MVPKQKPNHSVRNEGEGKWCFRKKIWEGTNNTKPEAPKEAVSNEDLATGILKIEKKDEITAELRYKTCRPIIDSATKRLQHKHIDSMAEALMWEFR